ncbi:MAG TPA: alpha/beta fold hydrolase [Streptosporangiaceae bacterium]|nr:alpha/beta fold hydrolase [Streptosporangiaceae bacterium]
MSPENPKSENVRATASALPEAAGDLAGALDLLLADGALGVLRRFRPDGATLRLAASLARNPQSVAGQAALLGTELGRIATGRSQVAPQRKDRRFADPAWTHNPLLKRAMQAYLTTAQAAELMLATADLDWRDGERLRFVLANVIAAASPSNNPLLNPAGLKALVDTGGLSAVRGMRALMRDLATAPRVPAMVEPGAFEVGKDLAVTPGAVVYRTEMFELIQYTPVTERVGKFPLLIVPPMINKYYITDLAPGRSMSEYLVGQGHQVFAISWRNPDYRHKDWNLDSYGAAVADALDVIRAITKAAKASICALCSGGIVSSMVAAHLSAVGQLDTVASLCLGVTVLDQTRAGTAGAMIDEATATAAMAASRARGYLDGRTLAEVFAWLRPDDLIWNYWVNNYLQGRPPPAFDILYWNADTTRLPAALHRDFIRLALDNALVKPDAAVMLGSPVDLSKVDSDAYVVAGIADHLCPWQSCYRTTQLLGGEVTFALSTSGHIASMVNPPDNPKATFQLAAENPPDPGQWLAGATTMNGSWWPHYSAWLAERSGGTKRSKLKAGSKEFGALCPAPGTYVHDR